MLKNSKKIKLDKQQFTIKIIVKITFPSQTNKVARTLLDTGTTKLIVLKKFVHGSQVQRTTERLTKWLTMGGEFLTNKTAKVNFKIP